MRETEREIHSKRDRERYIYSERDRERERERDTVRETEREIQRKNKSTVGQWQRRPNSLQATSMRGPRYLFQMVTQKYVRTRRVEIGNLILLGLCLHRQEAQIWNNIHTCATCIELPSAICTMARPLFLLGHEHFPVKFLHA